MPNDNNDAENPPPHDAEAPWLSRPDWASGNLRPARRGYTTVVVMAIGWNAFCLGAGFVAFPHLREQVAAGEYLFLLLLLFPLLGVLMLISAVRSVRQARRLGRLRLELKTIPASTGQFLGGVLHSDRQLDLRDGVRLTLSCYRETVTTTTRGLPPGARPTASRRARGAVVDQITTEPIWQETQLIDRELLEQDRTRTVLPIYFRLPHDVPGTETGRRARGVYWKLQVSFDKAERAGLHSAAEFDVPVFRTAASEEPFAGPATADPAAEFKSDKPLFDSPEEEGLRVTVSPRGGTVFHFEAPPAIRGFGCTATLLALVTIAGAVAWALWQSEPSLQPGLVALGVGLLFALLACYIHFSVHRLTLEVGSAAYEHTLFGIGARRQFDPALIQKVEPQRDRGDTQKIQYNIPLVVLAPKPTGEAYRTQYTLIRGLARETADKIAGQVQAVVQQSIVGAKREYRVREGRDPDQLHKAMRMQRWIVRTVTTSAVVVIAFFAGEILYHQFMSDSPADSPAAVTDQAEEPSPSPLPLIEQ